MHNYDIWKMYPQYVSDYNFEGLLVDRMDEKRKEAETACAKIVGIELAPAFSRILSAQYMEYECSDSVKIAEKLGLGEEHFLAIENKTKEFKDWLVDDMVHIPDYEGRSYDRDCC